MILNEVVIYKKFTTEDIIALLRFALNRDRATLKLSDGTCVSLLTNDTFEFELIEKDYVVDT